MNEDAYCKSCRYKLYCTTRDLTPIFADDSPGTWKPVHKRIPTWIAKGWYPKESCRWYLECSTTYLLEKEKRELSTWIKKTKKEMFPPLNRKIFR